MKPLFKRVSRATLVFKRLQAADRLELLAQLLWVVRDKGFKPGWAAHKFKLLFSDWPPRETAPEPQQPRSDLMTWLANQRRNYSAKRKRDDAKLAAANAKRLANIEAILTELEATHRESGGRFRQPDDGMALRIVRRIEHRMIENGYRGYLREDDHL